MTAVELKTLPLFAGVAPEILAAAIPQPSLRTFLPGDCLLRKDDVADGLFVIKRGTVLVDFEGTSLVTRRGHDLVGEQAMLAADSRRTATVTARDLVSALWVPQAAFEILVRDSHFAMNLARALSSKLSQATADRGYRYAKEAEVFGEFRAHVSPNVLDRLLQDGARYGAPRTTSAVILFSDIRNFTDRSSSMPPERIAQELTGYFDHVVALVHEHHGMVDKFVGDAVMAVWGAFENLGPERPRDAFACARRMVATAENFSFGGQAITIGVGLNAGTVFVGNVGGNGKRQFTVLGAPVNLAARFEAKTKELGTSIVLGEPLVRQLSHDLRRVLREYRDVEIKGAGRQIVFGFDPLAGS